MNDLNFSELLKVLKNRTKKNWSQIAKELDMSEATIYNWLKGNLPTRPTLISLAEFFEIDEKHLFDACARTYREKFENENV